MTADMYGNIAIVAYALAIISAVITLVLFFVLNIRKVFNDLSGRTAEKAIADLRKDKSNRANFFNPENKNFATFKNKKDSGSLQVRQVSAREKTGAQNKVSYTKAPTKTPEKAEEQTTLLQTSKSATESVASEQGTTLLTKNKEPEAETTLLQKTGESNES